ncbi:MAG: M23 family metallopeptidase [Bacteroidales bacterium]|nr:M23 family metallopeptidase [Bacteroidales bacterium]
MSRKKEYIFNKKTLSYELAEQSSLFSSSLRKMLLYSVSGVAFFLLILYVTTDILEITTPKTLLLEKNYKEWHSKLNLLGRRLNDIDQQLNEMERRDNNLYRSIFGMEQIPMDVRSAGIGGVDRYSYLESADFSGVLTRSVMKSDVLAKKAYLLSKSLDQISLYSKRAEEMAQCVPTIPPANFENVKFTSGYGRRLDPVSRKRVKQHNGIDLAPKSGKQGEPIYATGNGVVTKVSFQTGGFGQYIEIDHGFGYVTRYAHLRKTNVAKGQTVKRGQQIAEMGNTGRSTATHLHYEVLYMGKPVNPVNYYDKDIEPEDYAAIINSEEIPLS